MGIGLVLQHLLDENNTNVLDVSRATGVAATTIYSIIKRDSKSANISDLAKIAHHLGVTLDYFYERDTDNSKIALSAHEEKVITAYRNHPEMQQAVDTLLHVSDESASDDFIAEDIAKTIKAGEPLGKLNGCTEKK